MAAGKVAFGFAKKGDSPPSVVQAWDAATGETAWQVELNVSGNRAGALAGCTDGKVMYFTAGAQAWQWKEEGDKQRGEAVAIEAATGKVLWRSNEIFGSTYPVLAGDLLLLNDFAHALYCMNRRDWTIVWKMERSGHTRFSVGSDFIASRGYGGSAAKIKLADGKPYPGLVRGGQLGGDAHACGAVVLTPALALAVTVAGLHVRDVQTGALLWLSPGFAARACVNPSLGSGRVFFPTATSGTIFCWEPERRVEF
ncbi:MAG: outer membrane protein assembly factor BamB family protein [Kiritimatiellia bacterium]